LIIFNRVGKITRWTDGKGKGWKDGRIAGYSKIDG